MALNDIIFVKGQGGLGRPLTGEDHISGLLFYTANGNLNVEYGQLDPKETLSTETVCGNVSGCMFKQLGRSIQMILKLDNGTQTNTVVSSAVTHN